MERDLPSGLSRREAEAAMWASNKPGRRTLRVFRAIVYLVLLEPWLFPDPGTTFWHYLHLLWIVPFVGELEYRDYLYERVICRTLQLQDSRDIGVK